MRSSHATKAQSRWSNRRHSISEGEADHVSLQNVARCNNNTSNNNNINSKYNSALKKRRSIQLNESFASAKEFVQSMKMDYVRDHAEDFDWEYTEAQTETPDPPANTLEPQAPHEQEKPAWETLLDTFMSKEETTPSLDPAAFHKYLMASSDNSTSSKTFQENLSHFTGEWECTDHLDNSSPHNEGRLKRKWRLLYEYLGGDFKDSDLDSERIMWSTFQELFESTSLSSLHYSETSKKTLAEYQGGVLNGTLLSYTCRHQPPLDVVKMLVDASPETLVLANNNAFTPISYMFETMIHYLETTDNALDDDIMWEQFISMFEIVQDTIYAPDLVQMSCRERGDTLLHHVVWHGSPPLFVIDALLDASPDAVLSRNSYDSTPLHFAVQLKLPLQIVSRLLEADTAKKTLTSTDVDGCTPLHLACQHGVALDLVHLYAVTHDEGRDVLAALLNADETKEALNMKDSQGKTPLFHAIEKGLSTDTVTLLIESSSVETVENLLRIIIGCPRRRFYRSSSSFGDSQHRATTSSKASSQNYLSQHSHHGSFHDLEIQDVSLRYFPCLAKVISTNREFQLLLNSRASDRIFTAVMMADFYVYALLIIGFSFASDTAVRSWSGSTDGDCPWYNLLYILSAYLLGRELFQLRSQGMNWLIDAWNWLDITNIILVALSASLMKSGDESSTIRYLVMTTGAVVWLMMLSFLRVTFLPFSVFVNGVKNVSA